MFMLLEHAIFTCFTTRILSVSVEERALITREASLVASSPGGTMVQLKGKNGRVLQTDAGSPDYQPTAEPSVRDGGGATPACHYLPDHNGPPRRPLITIMEVTSWHLPGPERGPLTESVTAANILPL